MINYINKMRGKKPNFSTDSEKAFNKFQHSFMQPHGTQPTWLLYPRDSPGRNAGVGCHALLQRIFPTQGSNPCLPHCRQILALKELKSAMREFLTPKPYHQGSPYGYNKIKSGIIGIILKPRSSVQYLTLD